MNRNEVEGFLAQVRSGVDSDTDLDMGLQYFCHVCNSSDLMSCELKSTDLSCVVEVDGKEWSLVFADQVCSLYCGAMETPDMRLSMNRTVAVGLITGHVNSGVAHMCGDIRYCGKKNAALKLQAIGELFLDESGLAQIALEKISDRIAQETDTDNVVKFGVVGGGSAFNFHYEATKELSSIRFTAIYDANIDNAKKVALRLPEEPLQVHETLDGMLESDIDAVLVIVPHVYHEQVVLQCLNKGKHVLCEKPMATTVEACRNMIEAAQKNAVRFMIAENHRFLPAHTCMRKIIADGLVGDILMVRAYEGVNEIPGMSQSGFWKGDPIKAGGGALMDMGAHKFATLEYLLDSQCELITAITAKQAINLPEKAEDNALAMLRFENGAIGEVAVSFTQMTPPFNSMEIHGTEGTIVENHAWENPVRVYSFIKSSESPQEWYEPDVEHEPFPGYYPISVRREDEHFARCILEEKDLEFAPEDAMSAIKTILAGYLSSIEKRPVSRDEIDRLADENRTGEILEALAESIPINSNLSEVMNVQPVGYAKDKAAAIMNEKDLDLLIATSPVNVYYLSGLPVTHSAPNPILEALANQYPNIAVIRRGGEGTVFHWDVFRSVQEFCWVPEGIGIDSRDSLKSALALQIKKWGLVNKRVGVETTMPKFLLDVLDDERLSVEIIDADDAFRDMRLVKNDEEINRIQEATRITEVTIQRCIDELKVGTTDNEILALARRTMLEEGADDWNHLTLSIAGSDPEAPGIGIAVNHGDIVRLDFGAVYKNYSADVNAEVVIGEPDPAAVSLIDGLLDFQSYFEKRIKPGVNMKNLGEEAVEWYKGAYPEGIAFCIGHSIGLECEDLHLFGAFGALDREFEKNMVFEIEAWEDYNGFLIGVEDCYVVTDSGCRKMTTLDKQIISIKEQK